MSVEITQHLSSAARQFGVDDPVRAFGGIVERTFHRPLQDPAYRQNQLQPGFLPLEWSFSEAELDALRVELQPFDPEYAPERRLNDAMTALATLIDTRFGPRIAREWRDSVMRDATNRPPGLHFGAFVGLVLRPQMPPQYKIYVECPPGHRAQLTDPISQVLSCIEGTAPHFRSIAVDTGTLSERIYYLCAGGLPLLHLEPLCAALGMAHRFPALLLTILELTGGAFHLPPKSAILGIRRTPTGTELKVELVAGLAMPTDGLLERLERLLSPSALLPFFRWRQIAIPHRSPTVPIRIVSVRTTATNAPLLSVYAAKDAL